VLLVPETDQDDGADHVGQWLAENHWKA